MVSYRPKKILISHSYKDSLKYFLASIHCFLSTAHPNQTGGGRWLGIIWYFNWSVHKVGYLDAQFISPVWTCCKSWCVINGFSGENKFFYNSQADWEKAGKGGLISLNSYKNAFKIISLLLLNCVEMNGGKCFLFVY